MKPTTSQKIPLLVILGPTASGKSDLAVSLAEWIEAEARAGRPVNGYQGAEIISADSRQVYKGLDIGTGKITQKEMRGIPHHLLDIADPHYRFTALDWKQHAEQAIIKIRSQNKLPIICGGTGFYISALIDNLGFPEVAASPEEQASLEKQSAESLFVQLQKLDPERAASIDLKNKRRLARAIIIARQLGNVPTLAKTESPYQVVQIGITWPDQILRERIYTRLIHRIEVPGPLGLNMIQEAEQLHAPAPLGINLSYERMDELGLEYRYLAEFLQMKIDKQTLIDVLRTKIWQYARRQKTWWKRDTRIHWFSPDQLTQIQTLIKS